MTAIECVEDADDKVEVGTPGVDKAVENPGWRLWKKLVNQVDPHETPNGLQIRNILPFSSRK